MEQKQKMLCQFDAVTCTQDEKSRCCVAQRNNSFAMLLNKKKPGAHSDPYL
jgi:hypothetical protein